MSAVWERSSRVRSDPFVTLNLFTLALLVFFWFVWPLVAEGPGGGRVSLCWILS